MSTASVRDRSRSRDDAGLGREPSDDNGSGADEPNRTDFRDEAS